MKMKGMKMKRFLAFFMALAMLMGNVPAVFAAQTGRCNCQAYGFPPGFGKLPEKPQMRVFFDAADSVGIFKFAFKADLTF